MSGDLTLSRGDALANRTPARQKTTALRRDRHQADFTILVAVVALFAGGVAGGPEADRRYLVGRLAGTYRVQAQHGQDR